MNQLIQKDGMGMLPRVWTIALSQRKDFFIEPFTLRKLRYRCFFKKTAGSTEKLIIYFHLSSEEEEEKFGFYFPPLSGPIYFYGAFGQATVCQMRSLGKIREMTQEEKNEFIKLVEQRLDGEHVGDELPLKPNLEEKQEALKLIQAGKFYCFNPLNYACHNLDSMNSPYERD